MDKHNSQQKNKHKNAKKPSSVQPVGSDLKDQIAAKEEPAGIQGKNSSSPALKKK